jgi:hypothetical protein
VKHEPSPPVRVRRCTNEHSIASYPVVSARWYCICMISFLLSVFYLAQDAVKAPCCSSFVGKGIPGPRVSGAAIKLGIHVVVQDRAGD